MSPRRFPRSLARFALLATLLCLVGCRGPGRVQFDGGRCIKDGRALTVQEVEADQAEVARRISSRQPWFAVITIGIVLIAALGNAEKALFLLHPRHVEGRRALVERLQERIVREQANPVRFASLVGGSLAVVLLGGAAYVYLDVDKRASERALGMLQFCHLALRTQEEEGALDEQKRNLQAIESTAGDIRSLVGKLPPAEQRKAQLIVEEMNSALAKQGKIVGDYVTRTDEAQRDLTAHTATMEKGIASVEGDLAELRSLPANLKDLEGAAHRIDETTTSFDARFADLHERIAAVDAKLDALLSRPACSAPAAAPAKPSSSPAAASASASAQPQAAKLAPADGGGP